ncbi:MAG: tetratricopeptide repeat protein, partial [Pseudobdellovibrionaceae bacterium]
AKELDLAREEFKMALQFDKKTTLAHYYLGYVDFLQSGYDSALKHYNSGLKLQSLHYKCLLGLFDAMFEQKLYSDAYSLVPTIRENFPISPKRLGNIFICAVFSHNLKDVRQFFDIYQRLDDKPKELVKLFSAALLTAGRFYIQKNDRQTAFECFDLGLTVTGPVVSYLDTIIRQFLKLEDGQRAQMFLAKFPAEEVGGPAHSTLSFLVDWYLLPAQDVIEKGKKLVAQGYADKECFRALVKVCLNHGRKTAAEDAASKAVIKYPEIREEIYRLFEPQ